MYARLLLRAPKVGSLKPVCSQYLTLFFTFCGSFAPFCARLRPLALIYALAFAIFCGHLCSFCVRPRFERQKLRPTACRGTSSEHLSWSECKPAFPALISANLLFLFLNSLLILCEESLALLSFLPLFPKDFRVSARTIDPCLLVIFIGMPFLPAVGSLLLAIELLYLQLCVWSFFAYN